MRNNYRKIQELLQLIIEEGNHKTGEYKGYKWEIIRAAHSGCLCGYIYMDKATKEEFEIMDYNFHCGVTWGDEEESRLGKYGFDCSHSYDLRPLDLFADVGVMDDMEYRTMDYVEKCLKNTIDLLVESKK